MRTKLVNINPGGFFTFLEKDDVWQVDSDSKTASIVCRHESKEPDQIQITEKAMETVNWISEADALMHFTDPGYISPT
jgi:hypothetical protein